MTRKTVSTQGKTKHSDLPQADEPGNSQSRKGRLELIKEWAEMVKIEHTVFALPFALSGMVLAHPSTISPPVAAFTILSFTGARGAAMTLNRLIDAGIDARNPRTSSRSIPAGRISRNQAIWFSIASFALMLAAASQLPPLCLELSPVAILWLSFYSFTKRFTWLCHFVLGIALGGAALGGWIASCGNLSGLAPWILALAVCTWTAGFDIIYACQDLEFDRRESLFSIPARFGIARGLQISSCLHVVTVVALLALGCALSLGPIFYSGVLLVAGALAWEHSLVSPGDLRRVNAAFFTVNGFISIAAFVAIWLDSLY